MYETRVHPVSNVVVVVAARIIHKIRGGTYAKGLIIWRPMAANQLDTRTELAELLKRKNELTVSVTISYEIAE